MGALSIGVSRVGASFYSPSGADRFYLPLAAIAD